MNIEKRAAKFGIDLGTVSDGSRKRIEEFEDYAQEVEKRRVECEKYLKHNQFNFAEIARVMGISRQAVYKIPGLELYISKRANEVKKNTYNCVSDCEEVANLKSQLKSIMDREEKFMDLTNEIEELKRSMDHNFLIKRNKELEEETKVLNAEIDELEAKIKKLKGGKVIYD